MQTMTPHSLSAIIAQLAKVTDREGKAYADLNGREVEFTAFYRSEEDPDGGIDGEHRVCLITNYRVVGAHYEDHDTGAGWAGNRAELIELVGEPDVEKMEFYE